VQNVAPIIIKRKKVVVAAGHHGGAWKVAYADFVTAMMAFFMLMWLLNATTEKQRKGIADYFNPTIPIIRISGGGQGMFGGNSVFSRDTLAQTGTGGTGSNTNAGHQSLGDTGIEISGTAQAQLERDLLKTLQSKLLGNSGESSVADALLQHIFSRVTDEGLIVEVFDLPGDPLFEPGKHTPTPLLIALVNMIAQVFQLAENKIAVSGFTKSYPVVLVNNPSWPLSLKRAQKIHEMLVEDKISRSRVERVSGWSDQKPANTNLMSERNNRLEIILLRNGR